MSAARVAGPGPRRLAPLAPSERTAEQEALLARIGPAGVSGEANVFTTLARAPELFRRWLAFGAVLLGGALPARDRELLILRTAWNCTAPYEWGQHARLGRAAGLTDAEVARVALGPSAEGWAPEDAELLAFCDELHETRTLSDERYAVLAARYDERSRIEALFVVGHYEMLAMALNALGVEPDEGLEALPG